MKPEHKPLKKHLTPRQLRVLKLVADFAARKCYSPTIQELADTLAVKRSTVFEHIAALREKRLLSALPGRVRSLTLTSEGLKLLETADLESNPFLADQPAGIPFLGRVAAGEPIEAVENPQCFSLADQFGSTDDIFVLQVQGNSMIDEGIRDGDYIVCRKASAATNGQLVVALVDNENATVKRFYREPARVRLQPANREYEPIYSANCRIEAVVIGLVRKL